MKLWRGIIGAALILSMTVPAWAAPGEQLTAQQRREDLDILYENLKRVTPICSPILRRRSFSPGRGKLRLGWTPPATRSFFWT